MRLYETLMILHPEINEEGLTSFLGRIEEIIESTGGKIAEIDQWGNRKLAYRIAKQPRGYYTLLKYAASPAIINELERNLKLWEECLRFMTIRLEDEIDADSLASIERVHKKPPAAVEEVEEEAPPEEEPETETADEGSSEEPAVEEPAPESPDDKGEQEGEDK